MAFLGWSDLGYEEFILSYLFKSHDKNNRGSWFGMTLSVSSESSEIKLS